LLIIPHPKYSTLNPGHKTGADIAGVARLIHAPPTGKVQVSLTQLTNNCAFLRAQCGMHRERVVIGSERVVIGSPFINHYTAVHSNLLVLLNPNRFSHG